ncbi:MAG: hypothetical protein ACREXX_03550 [Gammaproteobacteria bacterium]
MNGSIASNAPSAVIEARVGVLGLPMGFGYRLYVTHPTIDGQGQQSGGLNGRHRVSRMSRTFDTRGDIDPDIGGGSSGQRFEGNPFHDLLHGPLTTVDEV